MKGWMHLNKRSWGQIKKKMFDDLGERVRDDMKEEFKLLPDYYYHCSDKVDSIVYDDSAKVIGSEEWAVAASDTGGDWTWNKPPPFDKIKEWIIKHKDVDPQNRMLGAYVVSMQKKILDEGIESNYWVDMYLDDFVHSAGADGSGIL